MASVCGTASAISQTPSTPLAKPPAVNAKQKLPAAQNLSTSTAAAFAKTNITAKPKAAAAQNVSTSTAAAASTVATTSNAAGHASQAQGLTTSNAATLTMSTPSGLEMGKVAPPNRPPANPPIDNRSLLPPSTLATPPNSHSADDLKKNIADQQKEITKLQGYIAELETEKPNELNWLKQSASTFHWDPKNSKCDTSGNCIVKYTIDSRGGGGIIVDVHVDSQGKILPGEADKLVNAMAIVYDKAIANDSQHIANDQKQIDADKALLPGHGLSGNGGADLHRYGTVHQQ